MPIRKSKNPINFNDWSNPEFLKVLEPEPSEVRESGAKPTITDLREDEKFLSHAEKALGWLGESPIEPSRTLKRKSLSTK